MTPRSFSAAVVRSRPPVGGRPSVAGGRFPRRCRTAGSRRRESSQLLKRAHIGDDNLTLAEFQQTFALPDMELLVDALTRRPKHAGKLALGDAAAPRCRVGSGGRSGEADQRPCEPVIELFKESPL